MDLIGEFTRRLSWEMAPFFNWALNHWAISLVTLLLLIRRAGQKQRTIKHGYT
jgi:hypothetical protein